MQLVRTRLTDEIQEVKQLVDVGIAHSAPNTSPTIDTKQYRSTLWIGRSFRYGRRLDRIIRIDSKSSGIVRLMLVADGIDNGFARGSGD